MPIPFGLIASGAMEFLAPHLPTIGRAVLGLLPQNASVVVNNVVDAVRKGIAIAEPVIRTMDTITNNVNAPGETKDISAEEASAAVSELRRPGSYERALASAKALLNSAPKVAE